jgi:hypothetical protein
LGAIHRTSDAIAAPRRSRREQVDRADRVAIAVVVYFALGGQRTCRRDVHCRCKPVRQQEARRIVAVDARWELATLSRRDGNLRKRVDAPAVTAAVPEQLRGVCAS